MATDKKKEAPKELSVYLNEPTILQKFTKVLGEGAADPYVQSVLIAVADSEELKKCTHQSILQSALRAASLGLSCDPAVKQAWLVPFNKKVKGKGGAGDTWIKVAQFQPHYMGLYQLAMRTGKYWQINVSPVFEGERVFEDSIKGMHYVQEEGSSILGMPAASNPAYMRDVTVRRSGSKEKQIIGWIGYFKTKKGFEKTIYMSTEEIGEHAERFVKEIGKNQNWQDVQKRKVMEMKTVLKALLNWADKSGIVGHSEELNKAIKADEGEEILDAVTEEVTESTEEHTKQEETK
jgi:recombination protein RecT